MGLRLGTVRCSAVVLLAAALSLACGSPEAVESLHGWNVLLVTLDTTRWDHLGCYGDEAARTPALDGLARRGVLFENAVAQAPITLPSHASIMTGKYPPAHGVRGNARYALPARHRTLAEILAEHGYQTAAVVGSFVLDRRYGLAQGFARYEDDREAMQQRTGSGDAARPGSDVSRAALDLAARFDRAAPYFLWVHYFDPHAPYAPPREVAASFDSTETGRYRAEIAAMDAAIGELLDGLEARDLLDRTLVVVVGDHGEGIAGPHAERSHGLFLYADTMRIPLIWSAPGGLAEGRRVERLARQVDVLPTLLDLLGLDPAAGIDGASLRGSLEGVAEAPDPGVVSYGESLLGWDSYGWAPVYQVRTAEWKFIEAPTPELYRLAVDPREATNVADEFPNVVEQLRGELRRVREAQGGSALVPGLVQGEDVERLEALGYVASARELPASLDPASLRDPKDGLALSRMLEEARALAQTGEVRPAIAVLEGLLAQDPDNPAAVREMSRFQGEIGEAGQAEAWLTRLVALRPDDPDAHALLAEYR
ncbi:MAG: sulfatase-like hydrolase/transferase, partial [Myxococcota bacterium]